MAVMSTRIIPKEVLEQLKKDQEKKTIPMEKRIATLEKQVAELQKTVKALQKK